MVYKRGGVTSQGSEDPHQFMAGDLRRSGHSPIMFSAATALVLSFFINNQQHPHPKTITVASMT